MRDEVKAGGTCSRKLWGGSLEPLRARVESRKQQWEPMWHSWSGNIPVNTLETFRVAAAVSLYSCEADGRTSSQVNIPRTHSCISTLPSILEGHRLRKLWVNVHKLNSASKAILFSVHYYLPKEWRVKLCVEGNLLPEYHPKVYGSLSEDTSPSAPLLALRSSLRGVFLSLLDSEGPLALVFSFLCCCFSSFDSWL